MSFAFAGVQALILASLVLAIAAQHASHVPKAECEHPPHIDDQNLPTWPGGGLLIKEACMDQVCALQCLSDDSRIG